MLPDRYTLSPWLGGGYRVLCDAEPELSPRGLCRKMLQTFKNETNMGIVSAFEYEFFLGKFTEEKKFEPAFGLDCYSIHALSSVRPFIDRLVTECSKMTPPITLTTVETDYGRGQLETPLEKAPGINAADNAFTLKHLIKQLARDEFDQLATFTSKVSFDSLNSGCASGGHFNFSLFHFTSGISKMKSSKKSSKDKKSSKERTPPRVVDPEKQAHFIAGVLNHCSALTAVCSPSPPCYHRRGQWSPTKNNYGFEDRTACIRGKRDRLAEGEGVNKYFELRLPSSAANPYLVLCAVVAAGLDGIRKRTTIVKETVRVGGGWMETHLFHIDTYANPIKSFQATPASLSEALDALEADLVICEALGARFVKSYVAVKRAEIDEVEWRVTHEKASLEEAYAEMYVEYV